MPEKKKILIADDEEGLRLALADTFTEEGFDAIQAPDGQAALDLALANHPDLVILDFVMPKMHGKDVLKNLMSDDWGAKVPILFLTNYSVDEQVKNTIASKDHLEYMDKTKCDLPHVINKVKEMLGMK
ncbi:MAG: response regulator [Patescibacteria group bacterium]